MIDALELARLNERDRIIFDEDFDASQYGGGVRYEECLSLKQAKALKERGFLYLGEWNSAPTADEFIDFAERNSNVPWGFNGFVHDNTGSGFTITGIFKIGSRNITIENALDFVKTFRFADEFDFSYSSESYVNDLYAWYD